MSNRCWKMVAAGLAVACSYWINLVRAAEADRSVIELKVDAHEAPRRLLFQTVADEKTTKNRVHWDVRLDGRDKDEVRAALEARGATFLWTASQGPLEWHTMADPEGNEFCIS